MSACHFPFLVEAEEVLAGALLLFVLLDQLWEVAAANVQPESQGMVFRTEVEEDPLCHLNCSWADRHLKKKEGLLHLLLTYLAVETTKVAMEDYLQTMKEFSHDG